MSLEAPELTDLPDLVGDQNPTFKHVPPYEFSHGQGAIDLMETCGQPLFEWQQDYITDGMGVNKRGKWSAFECELEVARQNGKSALYEARCLAGVYLLGEREIVYSAHTLRTVQQALERVVGLIEGNSELKAELRNRGGIKTGNNDMSLNFRSGQRIRFITRTKSGGRGLTGDCVILDEDQELTWEHIAALVPAMAARAKRGNPQTWYGGSAGGLMSVVKGSLLRRAAHGDPNLLCYRWAGDEDVDEDDPHVWARLNPSMGRLLTVEHTAKEKRSLKGMFKQERLSVGNYPREDGAEWVIPAPRWERMLDPESQPGDELVFSIDVKPDLEWSSVAVASRRVDGKIHGEVIEHLPGIQWLVPFVVDLVGKHGYLGVILDPKSPAGTLVGDLTEAGVRVHPLTFDEAKAAFSWFYSTAISDDPQFRHRGAAPLTSALASADIRQIESGQLWSRKGAADVSPLIAVTNACAGLTIFARRRRVPPPPPRQRRASQTRRRTSETADLSAANF